MLRSFLNVVCNNLRSALENTHVELFLRDISQYKYLGNNPSLVVNLASCELEAPIHASFTSQKGAIKVDFYYFTRTNEPDGEALFEVFEAVRAIPSVCVGRIRRHFHKKNVCVWVVETSFIRVI